MDHTLNEFGQPIGLPLPDWTAPPRPAREPTVGRYCRLEPLQPAIHAAALYEAYAGNDPGWTYLACGPFRSLEAYRDWVDSVHAADDPMFFAILDHAKPVGVASYMRITPSAGSIEVGHVNYSPALQQSAAATEAMYLMMDTAFRLGYRRYEWKCDALNAASRSGPATRFLLRGHVSPGDRLQGSQPRYGVVFDHRLRMAGPSRSLREVARSDQLRFVGSATQPVV